MNPPPPVFEWTATVPGGGQGDGSAAFISFPWNPKECFGKANLVPVWTDFEGILYRGVLGNMGDGPCLVMIKDIRVKLGKKPGDPVQVKVWLDTEPRVVEAPDDLVTAWANSSAAQAFWERLSPGDRRLYVRWFDEAKKPETRAARLAKAVVMLAEGKKRG